MSKGHKIRAEGERARQNAKADPVIPDHLKGCLSAAFLRAAAQMRGWDGAKYPESTEIILTVAIGGALNQKDLDALSALQADLQKDSGCSFRSLINLPVVRMLDDEGRKELEDAIHELSHFRILAVKISGNCKFISLILQFTPAEKERSVATLPLPRISALVGQVIQPCGARTREAEAHGPRRIELS